jgi:hypothetical protein
MMFGIGKSRRITGSGAMESLEIYGISRLNITDPPPNPLRVPPYIFIVTGQTFGNINVAASYAKGKTYRRLVTGTLRQIACSTRNCGSIVLRAII